MEGFVKDTRDQAITVLIFTAGFLAALIIWSSGFGNHVLKKLEGEPKNKEESK